MPRTDRRDFLRWMTTLAAAGAVAGRPVLAAAGESPGRPRVKASYNPASKFELKVSEVEFYRTPGGRQLMARVYQPQGPGPFPTILDLHGGPGA
jgi:dipeptidyl aminopeptidase/acylaminoacyl peptidase